ncbi:MAG: hypothetical protein Q8Q12_16615 [bacterium]|nr:hypothetical protein [bacterium]
MKELIAAVVCMTILTNASSTLAVSDEELNSASKASSQPQEMAQAAATSATNEQQLLLEFDVYRVSSNISVEMSRVRDLLLISVGSPKPLGSTGTFFTEARLRFAGVELCADEGGWTWTGKDQPPSSRVETIASPKLLVLFGQSFVLDVGSLQPIEYFEKRPDGLFELKKLEGKTGFSLSGKVEQRKPEQVILKELTVRLQSIERRRPIEGLSLDVGYPIVAAQESVSTLAVKPGGYHGMLLGSEAYGSLVLRLRVTLVRPGETDAFSGTPPSE